MYPAATLTFTLQAPQADLVKKAGEPQSNADLGTILPRFSEVYDENGEALGKAVAAETSGDAGEKSVDTAFAQPFVIASLPPLAPTEIGMSNPPEFEPMRDDPVPVPAIEREAEKGKTVFHASRDFVPMPFYGQNDSAVAPEPLPRTSRENHTPYPQANTLFTPPREGAHEPQYDDSHSSADPNPAPHGRITPMVTTSETNPSHLRPREVSSEVEHFEGSPSAVFTLPLHEPTTSTARTSVADSPPTAPYRVVSGSGYIEGNPSMASGAIPPETSRSAPDSNPLPMPPYEVASGSGYIEGNPAAIVSLAQNGATAVKTPVLETNAPSMRTVDQPVRAGFGKGHPTAAYAPARYQPSIPAAKQSEANAPSLRPSEAFNGFGDMEGDSTVAFTVTVQPSTTPMMSRSDTNAPAAPPREVSSGYGYVDENPITVFAPVAPETSMPLEKNAIESNPITTSAPNSAPSPTQIPATRENVSAQPHQELLETTAPMDRVLPQNARQMLLAQTNGDVELVPREQSATVVAPTYGATSAAGSLPSDSRSDFRQATPLTSVPESAARLQTLDGATQPIIASETASEVSNLADVSTLSFRKNENRDVATPPALNDSAQTPAISAGHSLQAVLPVDNSVPVLRDTFVLQTAHAPLAKVIVTHAKNQPEDVLDVEMAPVELGNLRLKMQVTHDAIHVVITAERGDTLDLLRRNGEQLLQDLKQSGYAQASLSFGHWGGGGANAAPQSRTATRAMRQGEKEGIAIAAPADAPLLHTGNGIDLRF